MKRNLLQVLLAMGLCGYLSSCVTPSTKASLPDFATSLTRQMADKAHLTEGQYDRVRKLHIQQLAEVKRLKKKLDHQPILLQNRLEEVRSQYEWELATILLPEQLASLEPYQNEWTAQLVESPNQGIAKSL
jgi:hypothetical protein